MRARANHLVVGLLLTALLLGLCHGTATGAPPATAPSSPRSSPTPAVVIQFQGQVDDYTRDALIRRFAQARALGAKAIILQIDTYGGLVTSGLDISHFLKRQTDLHVIAYVPEKAISAGAMIALACDQIVMGPGAQIGDAAPIQVSPGIGQLQPLPATERAKAESPVLEDFRDSAERHGYNPLLVESMVSVGREVHWIQNDQHQRRFVDGPEYQQLIKTGDWHPVADVRNPVDAPDTLLTLSTPLAIKLGLAAAEAPSAQALAQMRDYQILATLAPSPGDKLIEWLGSAPSRFVLLVVFLLSLYVALHTPGHGMPEAVALISLGVLVGVPLLTGFAQWWEIVAILVGLALLAFEVFVFPGHMVSGLIGLILVLGGFVMTFVPKEPGGWPGFIPSLDATRAALQQGLIIVFSGLVCSMLLGMLLSRFLPRIPLFGRLVLTATSGGEPAPDARRPLSSTEPPALFPSLGAVGRAITDLRPGGSAEFYDPTTGDTRLVDVVSESGFAPAHSKVLVRELRGGYVLVRVAQ